MNGFSFEFGKKKTFAVANPYPGNIIINPDFSDGSTNWTKRSDTGGTSSITDGKLTFTSSSNGGDTIWDIDQLIPDGSYTVYMLVTHTGAGSIEAIPNIATFPLGGSYIDNYTGNDTTVISGTVTVAGGGGSAQIAMQIITTNSGTTVDLTGFYLVPQ